MKLRAVIFDYGMVLSGPPNLTIMAKLIQRSGLPSDQAEALYRKYRHDYDRGDLGGLAYWQKILDEGNVPYTQELIHELAELDALMWTGTNQPLIDWQAKLHTAGIKTAILSNLGDVVKECVLRDLPWFQNFDARVFSYELGVIKPDPAIYLHTLKQLGTKAEETLFIDDLEVNVLAARALGLAGIQYVGVEELRNALVALNLVEALPLPVAH